MIAINNLRTTQLTPRRFPDITAVIPPRKLPSALARTLNQTARVVKELARRADGVCIGAELEVRDAYAYEIDR